MANSLGLYELGDIRTSRTVIRIGDLRFYMDKTFNWFQKIMLKCFFGIDEIKEFNYEKENKNKNE